MKTISLTKGLVALVSDEDFDFLNQWFWHARSDGYAARSERNTDKHTILMHVAIAKRMGLAGSPDHEDRDGLNNQRDNLRSASRSQNNANVARRADNSSGFKGVYWETQTQKWRAMLRYKGQGIPLGRFDTAFEAAKAYNRAAKRYHGEFAWLNPIPGEDAC